MDLLRNRWAGKVAGPIRIALAVVGGAASVAAAQGTVLGRGAFGGLRAEVKGIRLFEGGGSLQAPEARQAATRFDALTTRFIYLEVELAYGRAARRTVFELACDISGPGQGSPLALTIAGGVDAGWTGSYHAGRAGSAERGRWQEGRYRVSCREGDQVVAATAFEVVRGPPAVRALGAALVQFRFYQSGQAHQPVEHRAYGTRFDSRTVRWIKTEFVLVYPPPGSATPITVECAYVFPDLSVRRVLADRVIPAGWTGSAHVQGIGSDSAGGWPAGRYSVSCWNNGERMAEAGFEVYDGGPPERNAVPIRFFAGSPAEAEPRDSFALGSFSTITLEAIVPQRIAADSLALDCALTDPAGITSGFRVRGIPRERDRALVAGGELAAPDLPRRRGDHQVSCRVPPGTRTVARGGFRVSGAPDLPGLDARLLRAGLFGGDSLPPGDEAVEDVSWSAARLRSLWLVAELERGSTASGTLGYQCRVTGAGPRAPLVASAAGSLTIPAGQPGVVLRLRLLPGPRQRWLPGRHQLRCESGGRVFVALSFDLTR